MALNIGNVNFGVDANTQGLQKAVRELEKFQKVVDATAKAQTQGADRVAAALGRQESAIKRAFQQTLNLQQQLRNTGAPATEIARVSNAFQRLTKEMSSGQLSSVEYSRSLDAFTAKLGRSRRALKELQDQARRKEVSRFAEIMRDLESASVLAVGPLSGLGARIRSLSAITSRSNLTIAALLGGITAVTVGFAALARSSVNASRAMEQANARFFAAEGSMQRAAAEMAFVVNVSQELALGLDETSKAYSRLTAATRGTAVEGKQTQDIFKAVATAAAALRLGTVEVDGAFRAIEQIMSKGTVQAEELRGQLGERLPGAFRLAAEAMGVTTQKLNDMLKNGEVISDEFLPKFAKLLQTTFAGAAKQNVDSFQGSLNLLANAALLFADKFDRMTGISTAVIGAIKALTGTIDFLRENMRNMVGVIGAVLGGLTVLAGPQIIAGTIALGRAIAGAAAAMNLLNIAILANPAGKLVTTLIKMVSVIGGVVVGFFGFRALTDDITERVDELNKTMDDLEKTGTSVPGKISQAYKSMKSEIQDLIDEHKSLQGALKMRAFGFDPRELVPFRQALEELSHLGAADLQDLAKKLSDALGRDVNPNLVNIAQALGEMRHQVELNKKAVNEWLDAWDTDRIRDGLYDLNAEMQTMQQRLAAAKQGSGALAFFDQVTAKVEQVRDSFRSMGNGLLPPEVERAVQAYQELFVKTLRTETINDITKSVQKLNMQMIALAQGETAVDYFNDVTSKMIEFEEKLRATGLSGKALEEELTKIRTALENVAAAEKAVKIREVLKGAREQAADLRGELIAMSKGSESLKYFNQVTAAVRDFTRSLIEGKVPLEERNRLVDEYRALLEQQYAMQKKIEVADDFSRAVVNGLEQIVYNAHNAKDALRDLLQEIQNIMFRAVVLQPLQDFIGGAVSGFLGGLGGGGGVPVPQITPTVQTLPAAAHGLSMQVKGFGGTDSQLVSFYATPGERVDVSPLGRGPSGGGGGGGTSIQVIDQRGSDAPPVDIQTQMRDGQEQVRIMIRAEVAGMFSDGSIDRQFKGASMPVRRVGRR